MQKKDYKNAISFYHKGLRVLEKFPGQKNPSVEKDAAKALQYIEDMQAKIQELQISHDKTESLLP